MKDHYVLECDGINQGYDGYSYEAQFDETGAKLESLRLVHDPHRSGYFIPMGNDSFNTYIVVER